MIGNNKLTFKEKADLERVKRSGARKYRRFEDYYQSLARNRGLYLSEAKEIWDLSERLKKKGY